MLVCCHQNISIFGSIATETPRIKLSSHVGLKLLRPESLDYFRNNLHPLWTHCCSDFSVSWVQNIAHYRIILGHRLIILFRLTPLLVSRGCSFCIKQFKRQSDCLILLYDKHTFTLVWSVF